MSTRRWKVCFLLSGLVLEPGLANLALGQSENIITISSDVVFVEGFNTVNGVTPVPPFPPIPPGTGVAVSSFGRFSQNQVKQEGGRAYNLDVMLPFTFINSITSENAAANLTSSSQMTWNGTLLIPAAPGQADETPINARITGTLVIGREQATGASSGEVVGQFEVKDGGNNSTVTVTPFGTGPSVNGGGSYNNLIVRQNTQLRVGVPFEVALKFDLNSILNGVGETINDIRQFKLHIETENAPPDRTANIAVLEVPSAFGPPDPPNNPPAGGLVRATHDAFQRGDQSLIVAVSSNSDSAATRESNHATSVASRLFDGAPLEIDGGQADPDRWRVWSYQSQDDDLELEAAIREVSAAVKIINISFNGLPIPDDPLVAAVDRAAFMHRNLITVSAGNTGPATIRSPGDAFNIVTVGATDHDVELPAEKSLPEFSYTPRDIGIWSFSSRGPIDGRYKPDIVAPGHEVTVAVAFEDTEILTPSNNNTLPQSGTSFAAPYVASVAAHLIERGTDMIERETMGWDSDALDPMVIKAVLLNSAQEIRPDPAHPSWEGWKPEQTFIPLDPDQGAGEVSTERAKQQYLTNPEQDYDKFVKLIGWDYGEEIDEGQFRNYPFKKPLKAGSDLNATLDWFRELDGTGNPFPSVDNLDLELWTFNGRVPRSRVTLSNSEIDNVEHLHRFVIPDDDTYGLRAHFLTDITHNEADQYGLAWYASPKFETPDSSPGVCGLLGILLLLGVSGWRRGRQQANKSISAEREQGHKRG